MSNRSPFLSLTRGFAHLGVVYDKVPGTTTPIHPYLARAPLGWRPYNPGLIDWPPIYYAAYLASKAPGGRGVDCDVAQTPVSGESY